MTKVEHLFIGAHFFLNAYYIARRLGGSICGPLIHG